MSERKSQSKWEKKNATQWKHPSFDVSGKKNIEVIEERLSEEEIQELLSYLEEITQELEKEIKS